MPGRDYWKKRMEDIEDNAHNMGREYVEFAEKQFNIAQKEIDKKIAQWYGRLAVNNSLSYSAAQELLRKDELEEFHWTVEEYIKKGESSNYTDQWKEQLENASAKMHIRRLEAMKLQMQQECEVLYGNLQDGIDEKLRDIYTEGYYRTAYEIQKGFGVGYAFNRLDTRRVKEAVNTAWAQDGKNFSSRLWENKSKLVMELNNELTQAIIQGDTYKKATARLTKRMKVSKSNAGRLIMTEAAAIHARSQEKCYKELDVEEFEFLATLDMQTSEICQEMDGKHFPMTQYEIGVTAPPMHPWCRSCTIPYYADDKVVSKRAARGDDGKYQLVPADMTYKEWKETFVEKTDRVENIQEYRPVNRGNTVTQIVRGKSNILVRQIENSLYKGSIYISDGVDLKPKQMHLIETSLNDAMRIVGDDDNPPICMIISSTEMQTGAVCAYSATTNILYIDSVIGNIDKLLELQKDMACSNNPLSTYVHELLHWKDAQEYQKKAPITDQVEYLKEIRIRCKRKLDKMSKRGYNVYGISEYASNRYIRGMYDETLTEYRVLRLLEKDE